jgi:hypothetical protein
MVHRTHFLHTHRGNFIMATSKLFKVVGVSTLNGKTKVRFANDTARVKILVKNGHTAVDLHELPEAMTKEAALAYVKANALFTIPADTEVTAEDIAAVAGE